MTLRPPNEQSSVNFCRKMKTKIPR